MSSTTEEIYYTSTHSGFILLTLGDGLPMMVNVSHITHMTPSGTGTHLHILGTNEVYKVMESMNEIQTMVKRSRRTDLLTIGGGRA